jgi:signal peptidase I
MDDAGIAEDEIVLGEDEYFVLGDNRNASKDSRDPDVGKVSKSLIEGRAILRIYPFSKFGTIDK